MLISACTSFEEAVEHDGRGRLSMALLKLLDTVSPDKLRYCDILLNIDPIPKSVSSVTVSLLTHRRTLCASRQSPQCEGHAQTRLLFDGKVGLSRKVYRINFEKNTYALDAGAANGIAFGAEFTVYRETDMMLVKPLGTMVVDNLMDFSAELKPSHDSSLIRSPIITVLSAVQTKAGELADFLLYIPPKDPFHSLYHAIRHSDLNLQNIILVTKPEDAHLKIRTNLPQKLLVIELTDERVTRYGDNLVTDRVNPEPKNVTWILERTTHYHRELNRTSAEHVITTAGNSNGIEVQFFRLDPPKVPPFGWTTEYLTSTGQNLCCDNVIDFVVEDDGKPYGFNIINRTNVDLYVNAFFFDNTNFAICEFHRCLALSGIET